MAPACCVAWPQRGCATQRIAQPLVCCDDARADKITIRLTSSIRNLDDCVARLSEQWIAGGPKWLYAVHDLGREGERLTLSDKFTPWLWRCRRFRLPTSERSLHMRTQELLIESLLRLSSAVLRRGTVVREGYKGDTLESGRLRR